MKGLENKYYELMKYVTNSVGAEFAYCKEENLESFITKFNPDTIDKISKEQYEKEIEREHRKFLRFVTGYPKF